MNARAILLVAAIGGAALAAAVHASDGGRHGCADTSGCTGRCLECVPVCTATWDEEQPKNPRYEMKCEHACARARDSWHAPAPECRCTPPCGVLYVKKRFFKTEVEGEVERVPKYEVTTVAAPPCDCLRCRGLCWWDPFGLLACLRGR